MSAFLACGFVVLAFVYLGMVAARTGHNTLAGALFALGAGAFGFGIYQVIA